MSGSWIRDISVLVVLALVGICAPLGLRPLGNPDEGRYTEIPREMAESGDFVTPRLNGLKYFEKPPLLYWLSAVTFKTFGLNHFTARLWNGLFAVLGLVLAYAAGRDLYGRAAGIAAATVLGTCLLYYAISQIVILDMAVSVTISGALFAFICGIRREPGAPRRWCFLACYAFMALAVLSKGLIGVALPGAVMFLWTLLLNRWRSLFPLHLVLGSLLFLAIALPWHVLVARANAEFFDFYFIHEHFERFTSKAHKRFEPWWFLIPCLLVGLFPWLFFSIQAVHDAIKGGWKERGKHAEAWFLLIWIVFIMAFFSKSQSKLIPYVLPVFPAVAVLFGRYFASAWKDNTYRPLKRGAWALATFLALAFVAVFFIKVPSSRPELLSLMPGLRIWVILYAGASVALLVHGLRRQSARMILTTVTLVGLGFILTLQTAGQVVDTRSTHSLAPLIKDKLKPDDRVFSVMMYTQDLPVYLERPISVVSYIGEMAFGIEAEPEISARRFIPKAVFLKEWDKPTTSYAVMRASHYDHWFRDELPHSLLGRTHRLVLVSNASDSP